MTGVGTGTSFFGFKYSNTITNMKAASMRSTLKVALVAGVIGSFLSTSRPALATETRLSTLQSVSGAQDEVDAFIFPSVLTRYELALVELGTSSDKGVYGAAMANVSGTRVGMSVSRSSWKFTEYLVGSTVSLFDRFEAAY